MTIDAGLTAQDPALARDANADFNGWVDAVHDGCVAGWVADLKHPDLPQVIDVYVNGRHVVTSMADEYREDLEGLGIGDGRRGFRVPLPKASLRGETVEVEVCPHGTTQSLNNHGTLFDVGTIVPQSSQRPLFNVSVDYVGFSLVETSSVGLGATLLPTTDVGVIDVFPAGEGEALFFRMMVRHDCTINIEWDSGEGFDRDSAYMVNLRAHVPVDIFCNFPCSKLVRARLRIPGDVGPVELFNVDCVVGEGPAKLEVSDVCRLVSAAADNSLPLIEKLENCGKSDRGQLPLRLHARHRDPRIFLRLDKSLPATHKFARIVMSHDTNAKLLKVYFQSASEKSWVEERSVSATLSPPGEGFEYLIPLPPYAISRIRVDPVDGDGAFQVDALEIWAFCPERREARSEWQGEDLLEWVADSMLATGRVFHSDSGIVLNPLPGQPIRLQSPTSASVGRPMAVQATLSSEFDVSVALGCEVDAFGGGVVWGSKKVVLPGEQQVVTFPGVNAFCRELLLNLAATHHSESKVVLHDIRLVRSEVAGK